MKTLLWLDDYRDPFDKNIDWLIYSPIGRDCNVIWVKSYEEFCNYLDNNPIPDGICFDHDLGYDGKGDEKTGYDCAKYLVNKLLQNRHVLPKFAIQSANPIGRVNIESYLENYRKIYES